MNCLIQGIGVPLWTPVPAPAGRVVPGVRRDRVPEPIRRVDPCLGPLLGLPPAPGDVRGR
ncbi:hypothetical protein ACTOB_004282 [Actinoplanes oblitus]|uniref:Uncharacterized protein n=1 Tax=Actinoplanes oblitus TaxID=3040509 RepID=A0ABY8WSX8_9ACTN|nr:hypothetical protein [Actinoplanes oblitus]WIN00568.1 hypothetical protein ACTOB_004282 [Actinoplanes oblitus]